MEERCRKAMASPGDAEHEQIGAAGCGVDASCEGESEGPTVRLHSYFKCFMTRFVGIWCQSGSNVCGYGSRKLFPYKITTSCPAMACSARCVMP